MKPPGSVAKGFEPGPSEHDPRPVVRLSKPGLPGAAIATIALLIAIGLFAVLDARRKKISTGTAQAHRLTIDAFSAPPPLVVPAEPPPVQPAIVTTIRPPRLPQTPFRTPPKSAAALPVIIVPAPPAAPPRLAMSEPASRGSARSSEPALIIDGGEQVREISGASATAGASAARPGGGGDDAPARVTVIGNRTTTMPAGTLIPAVLETPIDTARPGLLRAVTSEDARGFDGRRVLVPKGSRLIGEYQADVRPGQNRVLVNWTRLIRPDGAAIRLNSPASDPLGGAGVPGRVHSYFLARFAGAVLQSALTVGVNLASRPGRGSVIVGLPGGPIATVGQSLLPGSDLKPKITVKQGATLDVFVARDLDFSGAPFPR